MSVPDRIREIALPLVIEEYEKNRDRGLPSDPLRRAALVAEEAGEALREALDLTRRLNHIPESVNVDSWRIHKRDRMLEEIVQCASLCLQIIADTARD